MLILLLLPLMLAPLHAFLPSPPPIRRAELSIHGRLPLFVTPPASSSPPTQDKRTSKTPPDTGNQEQVDPSSSSSSSLVSEHEHEHEHEGRGYPSPPPPEDDDDAESESVDPRWLASLKDYVNQALKPAQGTERLGETKYEYDEKRGRFYERHHVTDPEYAYWEEVANDFLVLADRTLDTVEDVGTHLRRVTERDLQKRFQGTRLTRKRGDAPRVVILGTGWAAHAVAKIIDTDMYEVVIVSPRNYFLFTPMLCGSSVGTIEFRSITEPIRHANPYCDYYEATCEEIFPQNKTIKVFSEKQVGACEGCDEAFMVPYDILVYAVGTQATTFNVPGAEEFSFFLKEVPDAVRLRQELVDAFERANMPSVPVEEKKRILSFVVVGGGPTGIEFAGEFSDFLQRDLARYYPRLVSLVSFKIIQASDTILPMFDRTLQHAGIEALKEQGIEILLNKRVVEVTAREIILQDNETIPYGVCVWAAGTGPRDVTKRLISKIPEQAASKSGKRGKLLVDPWLRVKGTDGSIIAMGDCVDVEPAGFPATGQVAAQQGAFAARLLNRNYTLDYAVPTFVTDGLDDWTQFVNWLRLRGRMEAEPFKFLNLGLLAYIGERQALAQVQTGERLQLLKAAGVAGFALWRSVYLVKQVSTRNRLLVLFDWMKSRLFGRDITRF